MQGLTPLLSYALRLKARLRYWWHYWTEEKREQRRDRRQLTVQLHELNPWTITEAEQQMRENAQSRVLRVSKRRL